MIHILNDSWKLNDCNRNLVINCKSVYSYIKFKDIQFSNVHISLIGYKELESICNDNIRYLRADITKPVILAKNMENPDMKKYRMIDGRHRLKKIINNGENVIKAYVLDRDEILKFVLAL
jgi:hypothetical protein